MSCKTPTIGNFTARAIGLLLVLLLLGASRVAPAFAQREVLANPPTDFTLAVAEEDIQTSAVAEEDIQTSG